MPKREFKDRVIDIVEVHDDFLGDYVAEFHDPAIPGEGPHLAVALPATGEWKDATVRFSPSAREIAADFVTWAIETARVMLKRP